MSPHVNNFVTDLVLMAKAMEELPQVKQELEIAYHELTLNQKHTQELEINIIGYKEEIERHLSSIRTLEVARDDAEYRFLQLEEYSAKATDFARAAETNLAAVLNLLNPPAPELISTIQDQPPVVFATGEMPGSSADPLPQSENWAGTGSSGPMVDGSSGTSTQDGNIQSAHSDPSPGQSEADPTTAAPSGETKDSVNSSASQQDVTSEKTEGKYSNKLYEDHPYYVSLPAWLAGGGTEADYHFRKPSILSTRDLLF